MENERSDPPLPLLCPHQVPRYKCPECGVELAERTSKAANLIKAILTRSVKLVTGDTEASEPRATDEVSIIERDHDEKQT